MAKTPNEMMAMLLEIEDGRREPTPEEVAEIQQFITQITQAFNELSGMIVQAFAGLAASLLDWWETVPQVLKDEAAVLAGRSMIEPPTPSSGHIGIASSRSPQHIGTDYGVRAVTRMGDINLPLHNLARNLDIQSDRQ